MSSRIILAICLGLLVARGARAQVDEYQVKAAFLYNFAKFVEWPPQVFKTVKDPLTICILGQNPFGNALEDAVAGKEVGGRAFLVRSIPAEAGPNCNCQILFVGAPERKRFRSLAGNLKGAGVLTVGEREGFASEGGIINFKLEDGKVRIEINVDAAERSQLRISSKLLSLAHIVKGEKER